MSVLFVQGRVKEENVADVDAAAGRMFAAIEQAGLEGIRYASLKLADGVTYVAVLEVEDGVENPLPNLPEFQEFQENLKGWVDEPAVAGPATVVGSYRVLS
jgi:hypothetical protein